MNISDKIIATNTEYESVPNGTMMTVVNFFGDNAVGAVVDGKDDFPWFMGAGTYKRYCGEQAPKADEPTPVDDSPKIWQDMTSEEKGALLLGWQQGKVIEFYTENEYWLATECEPHEWDSDAYRIKPEPKRETVEIWVGEVDGFWDAYEDFDNTHKITFDLIDGKPDPSSIKIKEV